MTIGHTETRNRYNIPHSNPDWVGISGATRSMWGKHLRNKGIPLNSLRAGVYIYNYYLKICKGNDICAAKKYKGIQSEKTEYLAYMLVDTYKEILALEKAREKEFKKNLNNKRITNGNIGNRNSRNKNSKTSSGGK